MPIGKKLIKRKPRGGAKPSEFYFNSDTQAAIVAYKIEQNLNKRNELYLKEILPAFDKLVENLINVYGFQIQYESKADLQSECVEFLYGVITKFDASKGTKAFSYFNVVAKNWLIIKSKQSVRNIHVFTSIDDTEALSFLFREEYRLNYKIHMFPKPYISFLLFYNAIFISTECNIFLPFQDKSDEPMGKVGIFVCMLVSIILGILLLTMVMFTV